MYAFVFCGGISRKDGIPATLEDEEDEEDEEEEGRGVRESGDSEEEEGGEEDAAPRPTAGISGG